MVGEIQLCAVECLRFLGLLLLAGSPSPLPSLCPHPAPSSEPLTVHRVLSMLATSEFPSVTTQKSSSASKCSYDYSRPTQLSWAALPNFTCAYSIIRGTSHHVLRFKGIGWTIPEIQLLLPGFVPDYHQQGPGNRRGKSRNSERLHFLRLQNHCRWRLQP